MKRLIAFTTVLLLFLTFIACDMKQRDTDCFDYPKQIDSLHVRDLYDTARLYIFTWLCDKKFDKYYRGQFELKYQTFLMRNDSLELFFTHSLPKELQDSISHSEYVHRTSIAFNIRTKQKLWGWDINGISAELLPGDERFETPATPEVLHFIRTHKLILNPCFLEIAKRNNLLRGRLK